MANLNLLSPANSSINSKGPNIIYNGPSAGAYTVASGDALYLNNYKGVLKGRNNNSGTFTAHSSMIGSSSGCYILPADYITLNIVNCNDTAILALNKEESDAFFQGTLHGLPEYYKLLEETCSEISQPDIFLALHPKSAEKYRSKVSVTRIKGKKGSHSHKIFFDDKTGWTMSLFKDRGYSYFSQEHKIDEGIKI